MVFSPNRVISLGDVAVDPFPGNKFSKKASRLPFGFIIFSQLRRRIRAYDGRQAWRYFWTEMGAFLFNALLFGCC